MKKYGSSLSRVSNQLLDFAESGKAKAPEKDDLI